MAKKESVGDGLGTSGFTLGVLSIIFAGWMGIIISVVGGIFCFVQQKNKKMRISKVGLILNIIGFTMSILFIILYPTVIAPLLGEIPA
jgi:glucose uptake protein GlcU